MRMEEDSEENGR